MKIIIAGPRDFPGNLDHLKQVIKEARIHAAFRMESIVSGGATGVDALGEEWAREKKKICKKFEADWNKYGKAAGPIRNNQMTEYAGGGIFLWDKQSRGTKHCIDAAIKGKLKVFIKTYSIVDGEVVFDPGFEVHDMGKRIQ